MSAEMDNTRETICSAILSKRLLEFCYRDERVRLVEPHVVGMSSKGKEVLFGWCLPPSHGDTDEQAGWRTFLLSDIQKLVISAAVFPGARPGFNPLISVASVHCSISPLRALSTT